MLLRGPPVAVKWPSSLTALAPAGTTNLYCFALRAATVKADSPMGMLTAGGASCATATIPNSKTKLMTVFIEMFMRQTPFFAGCDGTKGTNSIVARKEYGSNDVKEWKPLASGQFRSM